MIMEQNKKSAKMERKRIFISHASKDFDATGMKDNLCDSLRKKYDVVCSTEKGMQGFLHDEINKEIARCDVFFALITENYVRSPHCLYELSVARYAYFQKYKNSHVNSEASENSKSLVDTKLIRRSKLPKRGVFVVVTANDDVKKRVEDFLMADLVTKDLKGGRNMKRSVTSLINELKLNDLPDSDKDDIRKKITTFLEKVSKQTFSDQPYVGMPEYVYEDLLSFCENENIIRFGYGSVYKPKEINDKCRLARTIFIVSTTGASLTKILKEDALKDALLNGATINIIIPDRGSLFCTDVAKAECCRDGYSEVIKELNKRRIESEFEATFQYLNEAYCLAENERGKKKHKNIGTLTVYCSRTLLRQTIFLAVSEDDKTWGWLNMTMPPLRTAETLSFAISDKNADEGLAKDIINHCECLIKMAEDHHASQVINGSTMPNPLEKSSQDTSPSSNSSYRDWEVKGKLETYWTEKRKAARLFMQERLTNGKILIEVAAQHPLINGERPNEEFQKRLDTAIRLAQHLGLEHVWFYVPGSRHIYHGIEDKISLSDAGRKYLMENDIAYDHIYADEANQRYKGQHGVYNSADESYVASCIFKDDDFGRMICVCSPYQTLRKSFYYIEFGLIPECYGVPADQIFHDPVTEFFGSLHFTVYDDHNWQGEQSEPAINSRMERQPK